MKICILGLGVIGTAYGYAFQKAGHQVEHLLRENKRASAPDDISVQILDGRGSKKGIEKNVTYNVTLSRPNKDYDFILVSVTSGSLKNAVEAIEESRLGGSVILFCNFWYSRAEIDAIMRKKKYIIGFPTAGGCMKNGSLNCVMFDHVMLESQSKANISNYGDIMTLLSSCGIKAEIPYDMVEWIWLHMAINAGVTSTAAKKGKLDNPKQLALDLMGDSHALAEAVLTIRETIKAVSARGVDVKKYRGEIMPYKLPAAIAGAVMKKMFADNELTRRIMTLHSDVKDILYGCTCVYKTGKKYNLDMPRYFKNLENIINSQKQIL